MSKYFLYARKSTDVEDKQVLSIESQLSELRSLAQREGLEIVAEFVEKQSAKTPGRPRFNEMVERTQRDAAQNQWAALAAVHQKNPKTDLMSILVPRTGLEPASSCERYHLKVVRVPISPPGHS